MEFLEGKYLLGANLIYGAGLRISEVIRLRVKDIDFEMNQIIICSGKGDKDRVTLLPNTCKDALRRQIDISKSIHSEDLANGYGEVYLPNALSRKDLHMPVLIYPLSRKDLHMPVLIYPNLPLTTLNKAEKNTVNIEIACKFKQLKLSKNLYS